MQTGWRLLVLTAVAALAGCAGEPDCRAADALGSEIGKLGLPMEADRHGIPVACLPEFESAWSEARAEYCEPQRGFIVGNSDGVYYGVCAGEEFNRNYRLGRTLWVLEVERENLVAMLGRLEADGEPAYPGERADLAARLRVLDRDIPELETLARMQGLMDPAVPPGIEEP